MSAHTVPTVRIQAEEFDTAAEIDRLTRGRADIGAVVTFTGLCRDEAGTLAALELEHYPGMAEAEISRICTEASQRWPLSGVTAIHRIGKIQPGENIVLVVTASAHRARRFRSCHFPNGLSEIPRAILEERTSRGWICRRLGQCESCR